MNIFKNSSFGFLENNVDFYILKNQRIVRRWIFYCICNFGKDFVNLSWIDFEKDLKLVVGNEVFFDFFVGVWNIIFVLFGYLLIIFLCIIILFVVF